MGFGCYPCSEQIPGCATCAACAGGRACHSGAQCFSCIEGWVFSAGNFNGGYGLCTPLDKYLIATGQVEV